jgi:fructokinase
MKSALPLCHILKVSEEELFLLSGAQDIDRGMGIIAGVYNIPLIFTTMGPKGCRWLYKGSRGSSNAYKVETIDTTGAGDSFASAVLYKIICELGGMGNVTADNVGDIASFACAVSSLSTAVMGAIPAMPYMLQVEKFISSHS